MPRTKQFDQEEVLQKAMELFWKQGYSATSMQELVDYLGINRASLYDTFGGKQALFERALQRYRENNSAAILRFLSSHSSVKEGIFRLFADAVNESVEDMHTKGCFVVNTTTALLPGDEKTRGMLAENKAQFEAIFYNHLQRGVEQGEIAADKDLSALASFLFTLYNGIKVVAKVEPDQEKLLSTVKAGLRSLD